MLKFKKMLAIIIFIMASATKTFATKSEIGIVFHTFSNSLSDQHFYELVCKINEIYNQPPNDAEVYFYLDDVLRSKLAIGTAPFEARAIASSPKVTNRIDIYYGASFAGGNPAAYNGTYDAIFVDWADEVILSHEIGHFLGLQHPEPGANGALPAPPQCSCLSTGDNDCVGDTPNGWCNNIMNQGSWSYYIFTTGQITRLKDCTHNGRYFPLLPSSLGGFVSHYRNALLLPRITVPDDGDNGILEFSIPFNSTPQSLCQWNQPISIQMIVTTACPEGTNKHQYTYTLTAFTGSIPVDLKWGITQIDYIYTYPDGSSRKKTVMYQIPKGSGDCSSQKLTNIIGTPKNNCSFQVINNVGSANFTIRNTGYKKISVVDMTGRVLLDVDIKDGDNNIDISALQSGNYIIRGFSDNNVATQRFSKL